MFFALLPIFTVVGHAKVLLGCLDKLGAEFLFEVRILALLLRLLRNVVTILNGLLFCLGEALEVRLQGGLLVVEKVRLLRALGNRLTEWHFL